jgi:hypothetical protein
MRSWAQGLGQWSRWLIGESPLPGKRSRLMLAATVAVVALLVVGLMVAFRSPAPKSNKSATNSTTDSGTDSNFPQLNLALSGSSGSSDDASSVSGSSASTVAGAKGSKDSKDHTAKGEAQSKGAVARSKRKTTGSSTTTTTTKAEAVALAGTPANSSGDTPSSGVPELFPSLDPTTDQPSVVSAPTAPTLLKVTAAARRTKVTWSAPNDQGTSPLTGYNVYVGTSSGGEYPIPVNGPLPITGNSFSVSNLTVGTTYYFTVKAINAVGLSPASNELAGTPTNTLRPVGRLSTPIVTMAANPKGTGYWLANPKGQISAHGSAGNFGSVGSLALDAPVEEIVATPDGKGYWLVAGDGGVFAFGDAGFYGSMGGTKLNAPIVGLAATPDGKGYWEVASDGGVFAFGDATFKGSMGGQPLNQPVVGMASDPVTGGYWEVAGDGGIFAFGAPFFGSPSNLTLQSPVVGIASAANGQGYLEVGGDGGIFSYGSAQFHGSTGSQTLAAPVAGLTVDRATGGYWVYSLDGGIFAFGAPFHGAG